MSSPRPPKNAAHIEVVDDSIAEILCRKSGEQKIRMVAAGWTLLRAMHAFQVRDKHPDWPEVRVLTEVSARMAHGTT
jgi:hypothetical protein